MDYVEQLGRSAAFGLGFGLAFLLGRLVVNYGKKLHQSPLACGLLAWFTMGMAVFLFVSGIMVWYLSYHEPGNAPVAQYVAAGVTFASLVLFAFGGVQIDRVYYPNNWQDLRDAREQQEEERRRKQREADATRY